MLQEWNVQPIKGHDGPFVELSGLDPATLESPDVRKRLVELWLRHGVIVFRNINSPETHIRLSRCFGGFQVHPIKQSDTDPKHLELTNVHYQPGTDSGAIYAIDGAQRGAWLPLHYDLVYVDKVNHGGLLRPIVIPEEGGGTLFLDKITLYNTLPDRLKQLAAGLEVLYKFTVDFTKVKFLEAKVKELVFSHKYRDIESRAHLYPRSIHPLVYEQSGTGHKMLNFSPWFADGIVGMRTEESDPLLREFAAHVQRSPHIYVHRWRENDLVLWDNWRVLHGAEGVPPTMTRHLQRTTIAGDYGLGRLENDAVYVRELVDV